MERFMTTGLFQPQFNLLERATAVQSRMFGSLFRVFHELLS
jgi:hypothetical protein